MRSGRLSRDRGSATIEMVVLAPGLLLIIALLVAGGRIAIAGGAVEHAAAEAARAASIARTASQARSDADSVARTSLDNQKLQCANLIIAPAVDAAFATQPGQPAEVSVTVTCTVRLSDLIGLDLGDKIMTETMTSPLDTYRERG